MNPFIFLAGLAPFLSWAAPTPDTTSPPGYAPTRPPVILRVKNATYVANVTDPAVSRDGCASTRAGNRVLWTCADTSQYNAILGKCTLPLVVNTAGWTNRTSSGYPDIRPFGPTGPGSNGSNPVLLMYGANTAPLRYPYLPMSADQCGGGNAFCTDDTRWVNWPDQAPVITNLSKSGFVGYTWAQRSHVRGLITINTAPPHTLYKTSYVACDNPMTMPNVTAVDLEFWKQGETAYGRYGRIMKGNHLYLYGKQNYGGIALAKVRLDAVEDRSAYMFYANGTWTSTMPSINDTTAAIPNAGTASVGSFYHSPYFDSYIWIGQAHYDSKANILMSTAPAPEGPWVAPYLIWQGQNGDGGLGAYAVKTHPALFPKFNDRRSMYISYTQQWSHPGAEYYNTPLVLLEFESV